jgi:hypothetical protein
MANKCKTARIGEDGLGVEVRAFTYNAYRARVQLKTMIVGNVTPIPALFVEDRSKLPTPQIYPNSVPKIGEFGDCAANIVLFYDRISVTREAAERLLRHPSAKNLPSGEVAWAVDRLRLLCSSAECLGP